MPNGPVSSFIRHHFRHFNSATLVEAIDDLIGHLNRGMNQNSTNGLAAVIEELAQNGRARRQAPRPKA